MFKFIRRLVLFCILFCIIAVAASLFISNYVVESTRGDVRTISQIQDEGIHADAIVVLGASVYADGTPSDILADRLEVASDLYFAGAAPVIIASGDNRSSHYNESDAMKNYCVELGVPANSVYVDHAGYDTYDSIWRAKNIYGANSVIVVTQAYHMYRAISIAEGLGMTAWGVAADKGEYNNQTMYSLRENVARVKDYFRTLLKIPPDDATQPIEL